MGQQWARSVDQIGRRRYRAPATANADFSPLRHIQSEQHPHRGAAFPQNLSCHHPVDWASIIPLKCLTKILRVFDREIS
jgi:hypothetical protein